MSKAIHNTKKSSKLVEKRIRLLEKRNYTFRAKGLEKGKATNSLQKENERKIKQLRSKNKHAHEKLAKDQSQFDSLREVIVDKEELNAKNRPYESKEKSRQGKFLLMNY